MAKNTFKRPFFLSFNTPPWSYQSQRKMETVGHETTRHIQTVVSNIIKATQGPAQNLGETDQKNRSEECSKLRKIVIFSVNLVVLVRLRKILGRFGGSLSYI